MKGWVLLTLATAAAFAACSSKSNGGGGTGSNGNDAGYASNCSCTVSLDDAGTTANVPCGKFECVGGSVYWYCNAEGSPSPMGPCPPVVQNEAGGSDGGCTPMCPQGTCGFSDGCGNVCQCSSGLICQNNACGNGCALMAGDYCGFGGDGSTSCCQLGLTCQASGDASATKCCAVTGVGDCTKDSDCCDYPSVHCDLGGTGSDASKPSHKCIP
jgi:hypothetical protein